MAQGPQSWSPDSDKVAYADEGSAQGSVRIVRSDGTGLRPVVQRWGVGAPAWGGGGPNYYIKHVEVTQAISPHLDAVEGRDPLSREPYSFPWAEKSAFGHPLPLIAEKSTLIRVYIGDSSLAEGATERRSLRVSLVDDGSSIDYGRPTPREVDVTAPDVAPSSRG